MAARLPLLVLAAPLLRAGLIRVLAEADPAGRWQPREDAEPLDRPPALIVWHLARGWEPAALERELQTLRQRWPTAPVLLLLAADAGLPRDWLLSRAVDGLLEDPSPQQLIEAVTTLLAGGRVVDLAAPATSQPPAADPMGLGAWLLISGLQQIDAERQRCLALLDPPPESPLAQLLLAGRLRELHAARLLLLWLWGPAQLAFASAGTDATGAAAAAGGRAPAPSPAGTAISLSRRNADGVWETIARRLGGLVAADPANRSGQLLALEALALEQRRSLLADLLHQFETLRLQLQRDGLRGEALEQRWRELQPQLRRQALSQLAGSYVQLPDRGVLRPVAEALLSSCDLASEDSELPPPQPMLAGLLLGQPVLVEGRLLAPDEPLALLQLEQLVANWLLRNAEQISAELLSCCAAWPELRRYLLSGDHLATRNLERLRNQLNAQQRWESWVGRPIQLYESRRVLFHLSPAGIELRQLTEPRDEELRQLGWLQQGVTLALETRDALAPQLRALLRSVGDALVVLLTQVLGRAIGLVGRGILQGMGRSLGRS